MIADVPAVVVFADYRCTQLCSPILAVTGEALSKSGLEQGRDYRLIVVGFNQAATAADARQMVGGQIGFDTPVGRATFPLMGSERSVQQPTSSVGYRFVYDAETTRFAHPAALVIVTPDGCLSPILTGLSITGEDARSALIGRRAVLWPRSSIRPGCSVTASAHRSDAMAAKCEFCSPQPARRRCSSSRRGFSCYRAPAQEGARDLAPAATGLDLRAADRRALFHAAGNFRRDRPSVFALIVVFSIRYRLGSSAKRGTLPPLIQHEFEIGWTSATLFAFLMLFWWAGSNEVSQLLPPRDAMEIHVVAKQWMWKIQHPNGAREINMLHVPLDEPVRLD